MNEQIFFYTILTIVLLLITFVLYLKTPKEILTAEYKQHEQSLEERLQTYPKESEAIIVDRNIKKSLWRAIPYIVLSIPLIILKIYSQYFVQSPMMCHSIFGYNFVLFQIVITYILLAFMLFLFSIQVAMEGYRVYQASYTPPLDAIRFQSFIAHKSKYAKILGITQMLAPLFVLLLNIYAYNSLSILVDDET